MVAAVQSRVDMLSKSKKLPANLTAEKFDGAKSGLAAAKEEWTKALESFKAGNLAEAVSSAKSVKDKAVAAMEALGMQPSQKEDVYEGHTLSSATLRICRLCPSINEACSAQMNMWLHKTVLQNLTDKSSDVPKELRYCIFDNQ